MLKKTAIAFALAASASFGATGASAATFFGQDVVGVSPDNPATWVNSNAARSAFLAALIGVGNEDFESFSDGDTPPISLSFPGSLGSTITADLLNAGRLMGFREKGRFATSGDNYYRVGTGSAFDIDFSTDVAAFGFYGTDIGDFDGQLFVDFLDEDNNVLFSEAVGNPAPNGNVLFWGITSQDNPFRGVRFRAVGSNDEFGFDDVIVGDFQQVAGIPLPAAGWLLISGIAGLAGVRRFSKKS